MSPKSTPAPPHKHEDTNTSKHATPQNSIAAALTIITCVYLSYTMTTQPNVHKPIDTKPPRIEKLPSEQFFAQLPILPLSHAIYLHDAETTKLLLATNLDINEHGSSGMTLLFWSLLCRNHDAACALLAHGADPDAILTSPVDHGARHLEDGDSFLLACLKLLRIELFKTAINYSRKPTHVDRYGRNLLHTFIIKHAIEHLDDPVGESAAIIDQLLSAGIDIDQRSYNGRTALYYTLDRDPELATLLLDRGADPTITTEAGLSVPQRLEQILTHPIARASGDYQDLIDRLAELGLFNRVTLEATIPPANPNSSYRTSCDMPSIDACIATNEQINFLETRTND